MAAARNPGTELDLGWILRVRVNQPAVHRRSEQIQSRRTVKKDWQAAWLLRAVTCIDLTTLSGDDTPSNVHRLCYKARHPIRDDLLHCIKMADSDIVTGAVCVYPARVKDAVKALKDAGCHIPVASVATGFPAGQTPLKTRLEEVRTAVDDGASEIDIVINRTLALNGRWEGDSARPPLCPFVPLPGDPIVPGGVWEFTHEDHSGNWRAWLPHQCLPGQPCCHDGGNELHNSHYREPAATDPNAKSITESLPPPIPVLHPLLRGACRHRSQR
ncbi:deoxyribose-phosphate aldolase isoform X2 [Dendropsophus ebraccatus]|uniref:deoxyribose-phosphate aldolase isoform X2 n=1 Tax=Dendropsophus ebraccatus TaxID=150705 RepID=UPI003831B8FB